MNCKRKKNEDTKNSELGLGQENSQKSWELSLHFLFKTWELRRSDTELSFMEVLKMDRFQFFTGKDKKWFWLQLSYSVVLFDFDCFYNGK